MPRRSTDEAKRERARIRARLQATADQALANAERDTIIFGREFHLTLAAAALKGVRDLLEDDANAS